MLVSEAFKKDTLSKNTQIIPLVVIENFNPVISEHFYEFLSTNNIEVDGNYFKPLLLQIPSIKQKVNLDTGKYQTSSVTLKLSNIEYNNDSRLSVAFIPLTNLVVSIYYKSQSCTTIQLPNAGDSDIPSTDFDTESGCPIVFSGVITKVSHNKDEITLELEDISDKKIDKELPVARLGSSDNVPDKYKNSYYPMLYGKLKNAPTVGRYEGGRFTFNADNLEISVYEDNIQDYVQSFPDSWLFGAIKVYSEGYGDVTKDAHVEFNTSGFEGDKRYNITSENERQYTIKSDGSVSFKAASMFNTVGRVEALFNGSPKNILLKRNQGLSVPSNYSQWFDSVQFIQGGSEDQHIQEDEYLKITDKDYTTSISENHSSTYSFSNEGGTAGSWAANLACLFSLQWDSGVDGAKYYRVIQNRINNIRIPVKGDLNLPSGLGIWDFTAPFFFIYDRSQMLQGQDGANQGYQVNDFAIASPSDAEITDLISFYDEDTYVDPQWGTTYTLSHNENAYFKLSRDMMLFTDESGAFFNTPLSLPLIRLAHGDNALPSCSEGWSSMEFFMYDRTYGNTTSGNVGFHTGADITMNIDLDIQEVEVTSLVNYDKAIEKDYYLNCEGRTDEFLKNYQHTFTNSDGQSQNFSYTSSEYLVNPADIVRHILVEECKISNDSFDEDEFNEAWMACHGSIRHDYSVNKKINSLDLFSEISKSSMITPRIKNDGKIGFITTNKYYHYKRDYVPARQIEIEDIISYKLSLTPANAIVSKLDVSYAYDYQQNDTLKTNGSIEMTSGELRDFNINDVEDSYKNLDTKYIQDEASANNLRDLKFYNKKIQNLQIELRLSLSHIDLETGDLVKIKQLIDGIKAHGIDYTLPSTSGNALRYPLFQVIDIIKNIDSVTIKLHQLHALDSFDNITYIGGHFNDWVDAFDFDEEIDFVPYVIDGYQSFNEFLIGRNSDFVLGGVPYLSSYSRKIVITDLTIGTEYTPNYPLSFGLRDKLDNIFGLSNFGLTQWEDLLPEENSDGSGYGSLLNGGDISNFKAIEVRFHSTVGGSNKVLYLRNIKDTEFDDEVYDPSTTAIPQQLVASSTEIKLGWVLYYSDSDFNHINPWGYIENLVVQDNDIGIHPYSGVIDQIATGGISEYEIILYPAFNPSLETTLTYTTSVESLLHIPLKGDVNQDDILNAQDVVLLALYVMGSMELSEQELANADINEDGAVDVLDVITLVNTILGNI